MADETACEGCERPNRTLWAFWRTPKLDEVSVGNWNSLEKCPLCGALWVSVPHEPYASFRFWTWWPSDEENWSRLNQEDSALVIHEWHDAVIREKWSSLPAAEREHVQGWRDRTYRHYNPIDRGPDVGQPEFVKTAADLSKFTR